MRGAFRHVHGQVGAATVTRDLARNRASLSGGRHQDDIVINGRFYGQAVTGVQRYGRAIVAALDPILTAANRSARLAIPAASPAVPAFAAIQAQRLAPWHGHLWEQAVLPAFASGRLLNLGNTAPLANARQVVCIHDTNVFTQPGSYRRGFRLLYKLMQPLLARRSAIVTTVSQASASEIATRFGLALGRIAVLPNGHEHVFAWNAARSKLRSEVLHHRPFVLLLGSRAKHKNIGLMLDLAERLDGLGLDLVVTGGGARIFAAVNGQGADATNIHWLGAVSDDDLAVLLGEALCLAFPSLTEGFGLPIVEAMAMGCPVVSSDRASMPEVCGAAALLAAPDDPSAWLSQIKALAQSPALREELRGRGREQARRFSWTTSAQGYFDLLERLT